MYKVFTAEPGTWIFIEEPEQGLHPGLQRIFLETLARHPVLQEKDLTMFMSTHSNHLLGMAISELEDVSVFAFQRWPDPERFEIRPVHTRKLNLLTLLGVANSSVFLANCGIWVEGITDRKYLRAYLSAYLQSDEFKTKYSFVPQEDVHYAFFEYAGSNLVHYLFESEDGGCSDQGERIRAQFLCNRVFLLADQDEGKEEKHNRLEESQSDSFRYFVTPGIEVENLISEPQMSQALPQLISGLAEEDVARAKIRQSDYHKKRIGLYLKETFGDLCPGTLTSASGTLSAYYKDKLASLVCLNVTWENMSKDARHLAKALYEFIYEQNQVAPGLP
jgi:predicted ATP-dependent endonuclease of OLD family